MIVGESPGRQEVIQNRPFIGPSGQLLEATIRQVNKPQGVPIYITNTVGCSRNGETPRTDTIRDCRDRLIEELKAAQPKAILLLGSIALPTLLKIGGVRDNRGRYFWSEELGCFCIPTYHPAAILRSPSLFGSFSRDVQKAFDLVVHGPPEPVEAPELIVCKTGKELEEAILKHARSSRAVCDVETSGLDPLLDRILRIGLAYDEKHVIIVYPSAWGEPWGYRALKMTLENTAVDWSGHNSRFDAQFLLTNLEIDWRPSFDTLLAHYCVDEHPGHGLKTLAADFLGATNYAYELQKNIEPGSKGFESVPDDVLDEYLGWDCLYSFQLIDVLNKEMTSEGTSSVLHEILMPADRALRDVELEGALLDIAYLDQLRENFTERAEGMIRELQRETRRPTFNPNSSKQVCELMYDVLRIPVGRAGRTSGAEVMEAYKAEYPILEKILESRRLLKLRGTYVDGLLKRADKNNRVHASFNLFGTETGRLSCSNPNLQNIPTVFGPEIRRAFIAPPGWLVVEADYSQLELRVAAMLSGDTVLKQAYAEGRDIHRVVASQVFGVPEEEVTSDQRYIAKYIDFGILYGRQAQSLAEGELKCSVQEAQAYIDRFLGQFRELNDWIKHQQKSVLELGYVSTPTGRKRRFPLITDYNIGDVQRQAVNSPIQGTASDICVTALTRLHSILDPGAARIFSTVHDSILFYVREDAIDRIRDLVVGTMSSVPNMLFGTDLPFPVDFEVGDRWGDVH